VRDIINQKDVKKMENPGQNTKYRYYAFISYNQKDQKWAKWLQNQIESYRLPTKIRKSQIGIPKKLSPVFRDKTDLSGTVLQEALHKELESSRYLIVICSPNSNQSEWVNKEIKHFCSLGREKQIIPFIVDGVPFSDDPEKECFPEALREITPELLGIDVNEFGRKDSFLRVISTMLDIRYDDIALRDKKRRNRQRAALAACLVALTVACSQYIWYNTEHSKYYKSVVYRNEIPEGIHEVSSKQKESMNTVYKITRLRGKTVRLECVNSCDVPTDPSFTASEPDSPWITYTYNDSGDLSFSNVYDTYGVLKYTKIFKHNKATYEIAVEYQSTGNMTTASALSSNFTFTGKDSDDSKSEITRLNNTYNEDGLLIKSMYCRDNLSTPACDSSGSFGASFEYDNLGRIVRVNALDEKGNIHNCKYGYSSQILTYDSDGNFISVRYLNANGNKVRNEQCANYILLTLNSRCNVAAFSVFDENDNPCNLKLGYSSQTLEYDENGNIISTKFFDNKGNPAYDNTDFCHEKRYEYDENGRIIKFSSFDADSSPIYLKSLGFSSVEKKLDEKGRIIEERYFDHQGKPVCNISGGYYAITFKYDKNGYLCEEHYWDADGNPTTCKNGYTSVIETHNQNGQPTKLEFRDKNNALCMSTDNFAIMEMTYDSFGNNTEILHFDEKGNPCMASGYYHKIVRTYEGGKLISEELYDTEGKPVISNDGSFGHKNEYDEKGNCIRTTYYDTLGKPTMDINYYAVVEYDYDEYGNVIEKRYFNSAMKPTETSGYYKIIYGYDNRNNCIREERFSFAPQSLDYNVIEYEYDSYDNNTVIRYYKDGKPADDLEHGSRITKEFNALGLITEAKSFSSDGKLFAQGMIAEGKYNIIRYNYDSAGNVTTTQYLNQKSDKTEVLLKEELRYYDAYGNCIKEAVKTNNAVSDNAFHDWSCVLKQEYSPEGYLTAIQYYDQNEQPILRNGTFRLEYAYDPVGNITEIRRYGLDLKPIKAYDGYVAKVVFEYDDRGNRKKVSNFDENGKLYANELYPASITETVTDIQGIEVQRKYYDENEKLLLHMRSLAVIESASTAFGKEYFLPEDIIISYNQWNFFENDPLSPFDGFAAAIAEGNYTEKNIVICRQDPTTGYIDILEFNLSEGDLGLNTSFDLYTQNDVEYLEEVYNECK